ncbi:MAG: glycosyltransferase family 4 protein [Actinomycetota bacterium]|nr:glycosyltransferase family 4 protein [Actinomycetota bacterium]
MAARLAALVDDAAAVVFLYDRGLYALSAPRLCPPLITVRHEIEEWTSREASLAGLSRREGFRMMAARPLVRRLEGRTVRRCDFVAVTSEEEDERMQALYGRRADILIPAAIRPQPQWKPHDGPPTIGYLGSLDYGPNVDGLHRFVEEGWRGIPPPTRLIVAGRSPVATVRALDADGRVEVTDVSEDFDIFFPRFIEQIQVGVAPLWSGGAGVKVKTLTMLGAGIPAVLTPAAGQGLPVVDGVHCLIAEDPGDFARAVVRLLEDRSFAAELGAAGRELVNQSFTWPVVGPRFAQLVGQRVAQA